MAVILFDRPVKKPMLHANFMALCFIEPELLPIEVLHCGTQGFSTILAPVTLILTRLPSHMNLTRIPWSWIYTKCAEDNRLPTSALSKVIVRQTDGQTDRQTDRRTDRRTDRQD